MGAGVAATALTRSMASGSSARQMILEGDDYSGRMVASRQLFSTTDIAVVRLWVRIRADKTGRTSPGAHNNDDNSRGPLLLGSL